MAITNTTTTSVARTGGAFSIYTVIAGSVSRATYTSWSLLDGMIIVPEGAGELASKNAGGLYFENFITVRGNALVEAEWIKGLHQCPNHYQQGLNFEAGFDAENATITYAGFIRVSPTYDYNEDATLGYPVCKMRNVSYRLLPNQTNDKSLAYFHQCTLDVDGFTCEGGSFAGNYAKITRFDNYKAVNMQEGLMFINSTSTPFIFNGFNAQNCQRDFAFLGRSHYVFYGFADKAPTASIHYNQNSVATRSYGEIRKKVQFTCRDTATKLLLQGVRGQTKRLFQNPTLYNNSVFTGSDGQHINSPKTYSDTSGSDGLLDFDVLCAYVGVEAHPHTVSLNSVAEPVAYFTKDPTFNYRADFELRRYGFQPKTLVDISLKGLAETNYVVEYFLADASITESVKTTVDGYTTIDTAARLRDRWSSYFNDTFGEPSDNVSRSGTSINLGARNLTIDATASAPFAVNSSGNITIKCSTFTGSLITTGTVTLANGANVNGSVRDNTGVLFTFTGVPLNTQAKVGAWRKFLGDGTTRNFLRSGMVEYRLPITDTTSTFIQLKLDANAVYEVVADANAYQRGAIFEINTTTDDRTPVVLNKRIKADGSDLMPRVLLAADQYIADMFVLDIATLKVSILLPINFATDSRWNATTHKWTFKSTDFTAVAWKLDQIETGLLQLVDTATMLDKEIVLPVGTFFKLRQHPLNTATTGTGARNEPDCVINMSNWTTRQQGDNNGDADFLIEQNATGKIAVNPGSPVNAAISASELTSLRTEIERSTVIAREDSVLVARDNAIAANNQTRRGPI